MLPASNILVVTRTKDRPLMLARAYRSITAQKYTPIIWSIVNDGGAAEPVEAIAQRARQEGIEVILTHHSQSHGMEAASNAAIKAAGDDAVYFAIHDDDDSWHPDFLTITAHYLHNTPNAAAVLSPLETVHEHSTHTHITEQKTTPYTLPHAPITLEDMARRNRFPPIAMLCRKAAYTAVGGYDATLPVLGDWDFNLKLLLDHRIDCLTHAHPLARYHVRQKNRGIEGNSVIAKRQVHHRTRTAYIVRQIAAFHADPHSQNGRIGAALQKAGAQHAHFLPMRILRKLTKMIRT